MPPQSTRLSFSVHSCSGEDREFPAAGVCQRGPDAKGWHTPRSCTYPQTLVLRLQQPSALSQIQILSHECRIPTRVELHIGVPSAQTADPDGCSWKRLGAIGFADNEQSHYCARELKSIGQLDEEAVLLKLVVLGAHQNALNKFNQAAIVALNLVGRPLSARSGMLSAAIPLPAKSPGPLGHPILGPVLLPAVEDTSDLDGKTAAEVLDLEAKKRQAVVREDYDEAKELKRTVDRLRSFGRRIAELESKKKHAVDHEDYDTAKTLKHDIDHLRSQAASTPVADTLHSPTAGSVSARRKAASPPPGHAGSAEDRPGGPGRRSPRALEPDAMPRDEQAMSPLSPGGPGENRRQPSGSGSRSRPQPLQMYDERPAVARGSYGFEEEAAAADESPSEQPPADTGEPAPEGFPQGLPTPEALSAGAAKESGEMIEAYGEYTARCFHSKTWQLREAALQRMQQSITPQGCSTEAWRTLTKALAKSMKDKVANVLATAMSVAAAMADCAPAMDARDAALLANELTPPLVDKTGDTNPRTQSCAHDALVRMAGVRQLNMGAQMPLVLKPMKNQAAWRPVLGRLKLLAALIPILGIAKPGSFDGVPGEPLMKFVGAAFSSPNADVRATALNVALQAHDKAGPGVLKALPADVNPKMKEQLLAAIAEGGTPSPEANRRSSGGGGAAAAPRKQKPQPAPASPPLPPVGEQAVAQEDLQHYEADLAAREKALGADHPDVAEGLSNLAIMYNQQGDYARAQPLYERALAIWETTRGPDHADVAHTLTDLAVLHLEQGREAQGRPLLERALKIQEAALGPDHPDVQAIRDVLLSDD